MGLDGRGIEVGRQPVAEPVVGSKDVLGLLAKVPGFPRSLAMAAAQRTQETKLSAADLLLLRGRTLIAITVRVVESANIMAPEGYTGKTNGQTTAQYTG